MTAKAGLTTQEARAALKAAQLRCTASRIAVLQFVSSQAAPQSHADVADALVPQGYDKSTLYRCLVEMADARLLSRLELGDHAWRFAFHTGIEHHAADHPHFVCVDCGKVECLPDVRVQVQAKKGKPLMPGEITEITLKGHCTECKA
jgi:Fur family transcriptional regulator, ferric uptake regulator